MPSPPASSGPEINTDADIVAYLSAAYPGHTFSSAARLSGGTVNAVWRLTVETSIPSSPLITFPADDTEQTIVVKHAKPFVMNNPAIPFPTIRMDFEAHVMRLLPVLLQGREAAIEIPKVLAFDPTAHILIISDGGDATLKDAYISLSTAQIQAIGVQLGKWLAHLHTQTPSIDIGKGGNHTARAIYRFAYANVGGVWEKLGVGRESLGAAVNEKYGAMLQTDDDCVCHGDFWPGNLLVRRPPRGQGEGAIPISVVDWEMTRRGVKATDVAQFVAEAYLLDRFRSVNHQLAATFLESYTKEVKPDAGFWERFAAHLGVHLSYWPSRVAWASEDETRKVAEAGARLATMALDGDQGLEAHLVDYLTDSRRD